jgi:MFS transporter, PAT family, beta-lactamase induction signal transducer AmpG
MGYVSVTLGFVLGHHGVSVAAVAGLVSLALLPTTWSFVAGPIVDVSLTPRRWYAIMLPLVAACFVGFAFTPMSAAAVPVLGVLCLSVSGAAVCASTAVNAAMALTTPPELRGPIAGWSQTANLGGTGLGGGLGLWIAGHAGEAAPALTIAAITLASATPMLFLRVPRRATVVAAPMERVGAIGRDIWALARTRAGVLAIMVMTLPCALGAAAGLLPAAAGAWHASSDLVALVRGALGGVTTIPGCIFGGYLCRHFRHRTVYFSAALVYATGLAAMALAPHTPFAFGSFMILNGVILGVSFGAMTSVNYDALGPTSPATVCAGLSSLSNLPLLAATLILGQAEARLGVDGMLLTEAALGGFSVAGYALLATRWRPAAVGLAFEPA